jgi:hypothetical protein
LCPRAGRDYQRQLFTSIVIADIRGESPVVESVMIPPRRSFGSDITMPMFWSLALYPAN